MACDDCEWEDAAKRASDAALSIPQWKTNRVELLNDIAETIEEMEHVTEKQMKVIENAEEEVE